MAAIRVPRLPRGVPGRGAGRPRPCGSCSPASGLAKAQIAPGQKHYARHEYTVEADKRYTEIRTVETRLTEAAMGADAGTASFDFDPGDESLEVLEAWIQHSDGTRIDVPAASIYTRPSAAARNAPGFVATQTATVVFPQLQAGSVLHSKWRHTIKAPQIFGFSANVLLGLQAHTAVDIRIQAPAGLPLAYRQRGGFETNETVEDGMRVVTASIAVQAAPAAEPYMVAPVDVGPAFVASTLSGYEEIGAIYAQRSAGKAAVTPEIATLARSVAGEAKGLDAARALHDWVAAHIRYVAVYLDPADDLVPHDAASVLRNGYGDCKDHVVLMQALLAAVGIRAQAALVNWDNRMQPLPSWSGSSFNHALVYLPDFDVYGNTTDPYAALGALDILLSGKLAVIATDRGEVRRTPASPREQNRYRSVASLAIAADGTVTGTNTMSASPRLEAPLRRAVAAGGSPETLAHPRGRFRIPACQRSRQPGGAAEVIGKLEQPAWRRAGLAFHVYDRAAGHRYDAQRRSTRLYRARRQAPFPADDRRARLYVDLPHPPAGGDGGGAPARRCGCRHCRRAGHGATSGGRRRHRHRDATAAHRPGYLSGRRLCRRGDAALRAYRRPARGAGVSAGAMSPPGRQGTSDRPMPICERCRWL